MSSRLTAPMCATDDACRLHSFYPHSATAAAIVPLNRTTFALVFSKGMRAAFVWLHKWRRRAVERVGNGTE